MNVNNENKSKKVDLLSVVINSRCANFTKKTCICRFVKYVSYKNYTEFHSFNHLNQQLLLYFCISTPVACYNFEKEF